jgi:MFS family permease
MDKGQAADKANLQVSLVVLAAQTVMILVALLAGWLVDRWGRKPILAIGFIVLPIRIALYALASSPWMLIAIQTLDGVGGGHIRRGHRGRVRRPDARQGRLQRPVRRDRNGISRGRRPRPH